jgi:hypothetical protein
MTTQTIQINLIEANGRHDITMVTFSADLTIEQCMERYNKSRHLQSIKGFYRPQPISVVFAGVVSYKK